MDNRNINMTSGHPGKLLISFALPLMLGNVFQQLYTVVDTAIVGQGVGMTALAALGTVDWLNWMYMGVAQGFAQGFSVRMAQKFGLGDEEGLKKAVGASIRLTVIVGIITTLIAQLSLHWLLTILQVPSQLWDQAMLYSRIILAGIPAMMYYNLTASILRAVGDSRTPLKAMAAAAIFNIVLDCLAVFWLGWGIAGAAAATVVAQVLAGSLCAWQITRMPGLRIHKNDLLANANLSRKLMSLGWPVALQNVVISVGGMAVQSVVNGFDTTFIAGFTATNKLYGILEIAAVSYGYTVTTYTGQNFGAMNYGRIKTGIRWAAGISILTSAAIGGIMLLFGRPITMLFISAESARLAAAAGDTAYHYLSVMAICLPILYLLFVYRSALQGMGNTRIPLLSGVVEFVMRVGAAVVIGIIGHQTGIFYAEVLAWTGAAILLAASYYHSIVKLKF